MQPEQYPENTMWLLLRVKAGHFVKFVLQFFAFIIVISCAITICLLMWG